MKKLKTSGIYVNGKIHYYRPKEVKKFLSEVENKVLDIIIQEEDPDLTDDQQGYYRATNRFLVKRTEDFRGWTEDEVHNFAIATVGTETVTRYLGERPVTFYKRLSMATATKSQAREFIDKWILWLFHELHIPVPPPEHNR